MCTNKPGQNIADPFYSLYCYRRGGRTQMTRAHPLTLCKATPQEVVKHGRWSATSTWDMPLYYNEWKEPERIKIMLFCIYTISIMGKVEESRQWLYLIHRDGGTPGATYIATGVFQQKVANLECKLWSLTPTCQDMPYRVH
eukprot:4062097-Ditylum_brightwellii.AAC.1